MENNINGISLYSTEECERIARSSSLRYVTDSLPGIKRRKYGKGFAYYDIDNKKIIDKNELERIRKLGIPPAYHSVWICPFANGHIQATARDARNRKQYFYHPLWRDARDQLKFTAMINFGNAIFSLREHIARELSKPPSLHKQQIICAVIYLLDKSGVRIGNKIYAKENKTYGITTLRKKHLSINGYQAVLRFNGKNSKLWEIILDHKKIIKILKKCEEIPGYEIFKYFDENNCINCITSQDINYYLHSVTNHPLSAKDFRTWIASREAFKRFVDASSLETQASTSIKQVIKEVSELLGHTPSICLKNYVYPGIIKSWREGTLATWYQQQIKNMDPLDYDRLFLCWLEDHLSV